MYSTHNEGKSVAGKRFIRVLKNKIYKKCNDAYHKTIKLKTVYTKSKTYINLNK